MVGHHRDVGRLHDLGDDRQAGAFPCLHEIPQALDTETLEGVRAGAWLEGPAAQHGRTRRQDRIGGLEQLLAALHRAGAAHDGQAAVTNGVATHVDDRVRRVELS